MWCHVCEAGVDCGLEEPPTLRFSGIIEGGRRRGRGKVAGGTKMGVLENISMEDCWKL